MLSSWYLYIFELEHLNFHATKDPKWELTNNRAKPSIQLCQLQVRELIRIEENLEMNSFCFQKPNNLAEEKEK